MQIRFGKKEAMDILIRHTLNSVLRTPVQSLIVVASTAMITACILVCLCISSLFEQLAGLKAGTWYAGADLYLHLRADHTREVSRGLRRRPHRRSRRMAQIFRRSYLQSAGGDRRRRRNRTRHGGIRARQHAPPAFLNANPSLAYRIPQDFARANAKNI